MLFMNFRFNILIHFIIIDIKFVFHIDSKAYKE